MQIRSLNFISVDKAELADTSAGEICSSRASQASGADKKHLGLL
jgi:hypothetical protein